MSRHPCRALFAWVLSVVVIALSVPAPLLTFDSAAAAATMPGRHLTRRPHRSEGHRHPVGHHDSRHGRVMAVHRRQSHDPPGLPEVSLTDTSCVDRPGVLQVVSNLLDWGMNAHEAVSAARVAATSDAVDVSNRMPRSVEAGLRDLGYEVRRSPLTYAFAGVHAITGFAGRLDGGADPQRDGYVAGV